MIKLVPSAIGTDCDSTQAVQPGFGETYLAAEGVMNDMDEGSQVTGRLFVVLFLIAGNRSTLCGGIFFIAGNMSTWDGSLHAL